MAMVTNIIYTESIRNQSFTHDTYTSKFNPNPHLLHIDLHVDSDEKQVQPSAYYPPIIRPSVYPANQAINQATNQPINKSTNHRAKCQRVAPQQQQPTLVLT